MHKLPLRFLFIFALSLFFFRTPAPIHAQAHPQDVFDKVTFESFTEEKIQARKKAETENTPQVYDWAVLQRMLWGSTGILIEGIAGNPLGETGARASAMDTVSDLIVNLYTHPPASGVYYAKDLMQNAGFLATPAYAQGIGFAGLSPLLPLWKVSRNIAYSAIIIIMIIIGFMVIFRMKIDPKTVISVQAAIPKIVLTLLIITFSYPIVGFMVDMMYLVMAILISLIAQGTNQAGRTSEFQTYFMTAGGWQLFGTIINAGFSSWDDFLFPGTGFRLTSGGLAVILSKVFSFFKYGAGTGILSIIALDLIFLLILVLGILFTFIRIFLLLLNSYIQLLLGLIIGPLQLLFEAIPGRSVFSEWLLNIMANLVVFPVTVAILMFSQYLTQLNADTPVFSPPLIGLPGERAFTAFLGLGILFLAPTLIATVKKQFHPKPILPMSAGTIFAPMTGGAQTAMGAASQFYYLQQMPLIGKFLGGGGGQGGHGKR